MIDTDQYNTAYNMPEYRCCVTRIFPYRDRIEDSVLTRKIRVRVFWHILRSTRVTWSES